VSSLARLAHDALIYTTRREFLAGTLPFLREGLERGHACVVATTPPNTEALRHKLGPAAGDVTFLDRDGWYQRPVTTVGGWKRLLDEAIELGRPFVRIIGEVGFGPPDKHPSWTRYESALNAVFAEAPAWIICPYDTTALPPGVVADARRTHPDVWAPHRAASVDYVQPEQLLATVPEPMPAAAQPPDLDVEFGAASALREMVRAAAGLLPADRIADLRHRGERIGDQQPAAWTGSAARSLLGHPGRRPRRGHRPWAWPDRPARRVPPAGWRGRAGLGSVDRPPALRPARRRASGRRHVGALRDQRAVIGNLSITVVQEMNLPNPEPYIGGVRAQAVRFPDRPHRP